jgi:hypothetical protein
MSFNSLNIYVYIVKKRFIYVDCAISASQILWPLGYTTEFTNKRHTHVRRVLFRAAPFCKYLQKRNLMHVKCAAECLPVPKVLKFITGFIYEKGTLGGREMFRHIEH